MPSKSPRILMLLHMPWSRDLGGSRVQLELGDELTALGCQVSKFDWHDAFPWSRRLSRCSRRLAMIAALMAPSFASRAREFVRRHASNFDIIDAHQGNLPYSKQDLGYAGLLVARSVGLHEFYAEFAREEQTRSQGGQKERGNVAGRLYRQLQAWRVRSIGSDYTRSLEMADVINLPNEDELEYVANVLGLGGKCTIQPFGLSDGRRSEFEHTQQKADLRLAAQEVVFIGTWSPRKGSREWGEIVTRIKDRVPNACFKFLGTGQPAASVLADLGRPPCDWIKIVSKYSSEELPALLSGSTVGAFPSYIEGFGFAVLEKLAAGLPTVAYDVPGPRSILGGTTAGGLVPRGDVVAFADAICRTLALSIASYEDLSRAANQRCNCFSWPSIARETLETYQTALTNLRTSGVSALC